MCKAIGRHKSVCLLCFESLDRGSSFLSWIFEDDVVCSLCRISLKGKWRKAIVLGMEVNYYYDYEAYARECILRFKDGKDKWIAPVFMDAQSMGIKYRDYTVVYVPSSEQAVCERGFKHNELLVKTVFKNVVDDYFVKVDNFKQSEMKVHNRSLVHESMMRNKNIMIESNKILLFDDIMTTGNSLRACYDILVKEGFEIKVMALYGVDK